MVGREVDRNVHKVMYTADDREVYMKVYREADREFNKEFDREVDIEIDRGLIWSVIGG